MNIESAAREICELLMVRTGELLRRDESPLREQLKGLVKEWRKRSESYSWAAIKNLDDQTFSAAAIQATRVLRDCASALSALLSAETPQEAVKCPVCDGSGESGIVPVHVRPVEGVTEDLAPKVLADAIRNVRANCQTTIDLYNANGPQWTSKEGNEYYDASFVIGKCEELIALTGEAAEWLGAEMPPTETVETVEIQIGNEIWQARFKSDELQIVDGAGRERHHSRNRETAATHHAMALARIPFESNEQLDRILKMRAESFASTETKAGEP